MRADKNYKLTIKILFAIIIVLVLMIAYAFFVRPAINKSVLNKQIEAYNQAQVDLLNNILFQLQQNGYAQLPVGNQTLYLTQFDPSQIPQ